MIDRDMLTKERMARFRNLMEQAIQVGFAAQSHWGADLQRMVAIEEAGELIAALCQEQRGRVYEHEVREEVADVLITALQLVCIYGVDECLEDIARKTERLRQRVMKARGEVEP